jgi:alkylhydroperoxidase/carboxymuconolactone decarboxylase family protein YurZ
MPHVDLGSDAFGIRSLFEYRPETALPLCELAEVLLRGPSSHAAFAAAQLPSGMTVVDQVRADPDSAPIDTKLRPLLRIAAAVQWGGKNVRAQDVEAAREAGADDQEIHDTVLIAAAFCMYNRYVDGLATNLPEDRAQYAKNAEGIVSEGYLGISAEPAQRALRLNP